jgi:hypothetical protein
VPFYQSSACPCAGSSRCSFELRLLATRLRAVLPIVGVPMCWFVKVFPRVGGWSIYVDPRTKFIMYARKRSTRARQEVSGGS